MRQATFAQMTFSQSGHEIERNRRERKREKERERERKRDGSIGSLS